MSKVLTILCVSIIVAMTVGCQRSFSSAGIVESVPTIAVQGEGRVEAVPDEATVSFGLATDNKSLAMAYRENTDRINAVISALKDMGIEGKDIRTSSYRVSPVYPQDEKGRPIGGKPASFNVTQQLTVKVRNIYETGELIDKVMSKGMNTFNGLSFSSSRIGSLEVEAKVKAALDAREKAEKITGALGVKLGRVLKIAETQARPYQLRNAFQQDAMATGSVPQLEAGTIQVPAICDVIYAIEQ